MNDASAEYETYAKAERQRLSSDGYDFTDALKVGDLSVTFLAHKRYRLQTRIVKVYVAFFDEIGSNTLKEFSIQCVGMRNGTPSFPATG